MSNIDYYKEWLDHLNEQLTTEDNATVEKTMEQKYIEVLEENRKLKLKREIEDLKYGFDLEKKLKKITEECKDKHWSVFEDGYYEGYKEALIWVIKKVLNKEIKGSE